MTKPRTQLRPLGTLVLGSLLAAVACALPGEEMAESVDAPLAEAVVRRFQNGVAPTPSYQGAEDTVLSESSPSSIAAAQSSLGVDRDEPPGSRQSRVALLRFDLSSIPARSTIQGATLTLNVINPTSGGGYQLYAAQRGWSLEHANWTTASASSPWAGGGARGNSDRASTSLGTLVPTAKGTYSLALNAAGVAVVQGWVDDPSSNAGWVIDAETNQDGLWFDSSDAPLPANRPSLSITYVPLEAGTRTGGTGLQGEYHSGRAFDALALTRVDATVDFDWGSGPPAAGLSADTFSVRWTGTVLPRFSETYTFTTSSDDGVRLWVDGKLLIDNWTDHATRNDAGSLALTEGTRYAIKMEYYENRGGAVSKLSWSSPSQPQQVIPTSQLFPPAALPPVSPAPTPPSNLDSDGVVKLFPSTLNGSQFVLGSRNPNDLAPTLVLEGGVRATEGLENNVRFWRTSTYPQTYGNGMNGFTGRWHIRASGGSQLFTWLTQSGYLSNPQDLKNQELTVYVRVHDSLTDQLSLHGIQLKVRGGSHTASNGDLSACVMMQYRSAAAGSPVRFAKELHHPNYDYVSLTPKVLGGLVDNQWFGLKMVSYNDRANDARVVNRLYVDATPFTPEGRPANNWQLASEYVDTDGTSTGRYSRVANWGGWQTTLRMDALRSYDVSILSVREISPP